MLIFRTWAACVVTSGLVTTGDIIVVQGSVSLLVSIICFFDSDIYPLSILKTNYLGELITTCVNDSMIISFSVVGISIFLSVK